VPEEGDPMMAGCRWCGGIIVWNGVAWRHVDGTIRCRYRPDRRAEPDDGDDGPDAA
jgi:hypothetical protein